MNEKNGDPAADRLPRSGRDILERSDAAVKQATGSWEQHFDRWKGLLDTAADGRLDAKRVSTAYAECIDQMLADAADWMELWWPGGGDSPKAVESGERFVIEADEASDLEVVAAYNVNDRGMIPTAKFDPKQVKQGSTEVTVSLEDTEECVNGLYQIDFVVRPVAGAPPVAMSRTVTLYRHP
jgi:hypothetical protein